MEYTEEEAEAMFDEMLDDCYEAVKIGNSIFYASQILKNCDPIAYNIGVYEYIDYMKEEED